MKARYRNNPTYNPYKDKARKKARREFAIRREEDNKAWSREMAEQKAKIISCK